MLVTAKTKVAPLKQQSIPRLELCGALLVARLLKTAKLSLQEEEIPCYAWTDSTIVLQWLSAHPRKWKTFVANRTSEIVSTIPRSQWNHVPSMENPADMASRGVLPSELVKLPLCWNGPNWLNQDQSHWPHQPTVLSDNIEECTADPIQIFNVECSQSILAELVAKYSSWFKLIRITAWCSRFITNMQERIKHKRNYGYLCNQELYKTAMMYIKLAQSEAFSTEIQSIRLKGCIESKSQLISLHPFLDKTEILRVGGRIQNALVPFTVKHPVILPRLHPVTNLLIKDTHFKLLHAGASSMLSYIKQKYWIIGCKELIRRHIHQCVKCFREKKETARQLMGNLPAVRVQYTRPFLQTGIDYAGPMTLALSRGRGRKTIKGYIALFVCLSTKAVHIELVGDLTTETFIGALKRFTSRRGICSDIFSDNGTNFIGAKRVLSELHHLQISENHNLLISNFLLKDGTNWHLIPPAAPHFGGIWEAAVKSTKHHLTRTLGSSILTYEEMVTLLTQIEAILNSRPLCQYSADELDPLTPGHFLVGHPLTLVPEPSLEHIKLSKLSRWQTIQHMTQLFWKRWHIEYLTSMQKRTKWKSASPNVKINDVVLLRDENLPPGKWLMGKVLETHPGSDGLVRVVTLKIKTGEIKRPVSKLCILPI